MHFKKYQIFFSEGAVIRTKCNSKIETKTIVIWTQYPRAQKTNEKNQRKTRQICTINKMCVKMKMKMRLIKLVGGCIVAVNAM